MKTTKAKNGDVTIVLSTDEAKQLRVFLQEAAEVTLATCGLRHMDSGTSREQSAMESVVIRRGYELEDLAEDMAPLFESLGRLEREQADAPSSAVRS